MNIRSLSTILVLCYCFCIADISQAQISVVYMEGDAFIEEMKQDKQTYKKIVYGPLPTAEKIVLKESSTLRLLDDKNRTCNLSDPGTYTVSSLQFEEPAKNSMFDKFCDYFHTFFVSHSTSESKANYKNSIYAISRGILSAPALDFPLEGELPNDAGPIPFVWSHACDTCQYVLSINNLKTKANVFAHTGSKKSVTLEEPAKFLISGEQYYWSVNVSGIEIASENGIFTVAAKGDYDQKIKAAEAVVVSLALEAPEATTVFVMSDMVAADEINYGLLYGFDMQGKYPDNAQVGDLVQRMWYDLLSE